MHFASVLLLAVAGVSAHPSGHAHLHAHREVHEKREVWVTAVIDGKTVSWVQDGSPFKQAHKPTSAPPAPAPAATTPAAAPAPAAATPSSSSSSSSSSGSQGSGSTGGTGKGLSVFTPFSSCSKKRATAADVAFKGNTGCGKYGSNMQLIQSNIASKYKYSVKVTGGNGDYQCKAWNKIGPDGGVNGFFEGNEVLDFTVPGGSEQWIAFDDGTQGGLCCTAGSIPVTSFGQFNCPWAEFDFGSEKNEGWSGFDASQIVAGSVNGPYKPLKLCSLSGSNVCSSLDSSGGGTNAFLKGDEYKDGIGGNIPAGPLSLHADFA